MITDVVESSVDMVIGDDGSSEEWDLKELNQVLLPIIPIQPVKTPDVAKCKKNELRHKLKEEAVKLYESKEAEFPEPEAPS